MIKLLDCTLRDGGYVNNWLFSKKVGNAINDSLIESQVDIIEIGYLSNKATKNESTLFKSQKQVSEYFDKCAPYTVAMINYGDYQVEQLPDTASSKINGIRLAFHKKDLEPVKKMAQAIQNQGYDLFFQPMVTKAYTEIEFIELIKIANEIKPTAFYIVDSFGSMDQKDFLRYFFLTDHLLDRTITLGFHGHNNMQFVYANAINLIENSTTRKIIVDSSIFGMGRGAGNLNTEIIIDYLNKYYEKNYKAEPLLEVMDDYLETIYKQNPWGFTPAQYLSAKHNCHPNYSSFLTRKKKLSISGINTILAQIDVDKKNGFDQEYIDSLYFMHMQALKDSNAIKQKTHKLEEQNILVLGSGTSIQSYKNKISETLTKEKLIVVALNNVQAEFHTDIQFFSNQKRYDEYKNEIDASKLTVTSNIQIDKNHYGCRVADYNELLSNTINNFDNVLSLFLSFAAAQKVKNVLMAGIDGYKPHEQNYANEELFINDSQYMNRENELLFKTIEYFSSRVHLEFLTPSIFAQAVSLKILGVIPARYKSSRFEGKPLCMINNIPMIKRTYLQALKSKLLSNLIVATDNEKIKAYCENENIPVVMTSENCLTGTDRIAEVAKTMHYDLYVNIQGDEPVIDAASIDEIVSEYKKYGDEYIAYNLYKEISDPEEIGSDTIIKTIVNEKDELMYMSRLGVPFNKSKQAVKYKKQVCVYGFTKKALDVFASRNKTINEQFEDIEILRFIDMGHKVKMRETHVDSIAVDVPEDIRKVEKFLKSKGME